jgi:hypothetical protein
MPSQPWASGPKEILEHGLALLRQDTDRNRRLAMILIDNAVELMIKTYLGLPQRVTGLKISRKEFAEASESFPRLLDALEQHGPNKLDGIDLGEIEWYHRLRNELYHQGNGLTVERVKVDVYAELSKRLFANLFGFEVALAETEETDRQRSIGIFLEVWGTLERHMTALAQKHIEHVSTLHGRPRPGIMSAKDLERAGVLSRNLVQEIDEVRDIRNRLVHGAQDFTAHQLGVATKRLEDIIKRVVEL